MTFIYPVERGDQKAFIALAVTFAVLPACAVGCRIWARRIADRKLDISDWSMTLASALLFFYQGVNISAVLIGGLGYPLEEVTGRFGVASGAEKFVKHLIVMQMFWCIIITIVKLSVLNLYIRVFSLPIFILGAKITGAFIIVWAIIMGIGACLICQPFAFYWDKTIPGGFCGDSNALWIATGIMNIVSDVAMLILPMPYLYSLELALYKKLVLMATFGIGFLVCIVSAVRIHVLITYDPEDTTGTTLPTALLSFLEPSVGIIIACVPLLRPLLQTVLSTVSRSSGYIAEKKGGGGASEGGHSFNRLREHGGSQIQLRPRGPGTDTQIMNMTIASHVDGDSSDHGSERAIELDRIAVKTTWTVEERAMQNDGALDAGAGAGGTVNRVSMPPVSPSALEAGTAPR